MFFIIFYSPVEHTEKIKQAMFEAGAGRIGSYACCAFQTVGTGQFMPLPTAMPFIGQEGNLDRVTECRVEMICEEYCIEAAIAALKISHPYETPAYHVIRMENI